MKSLILVALLSVMSFTASADFNGVTTVVPGKFSMFSTTSPDLHCETGTELTLDNTELSGGIALMKNFVQGFCEIYVYPNPRFILLSLKDESCGSKIYEGILLEEGELRTIEITDNRMRMCEDVIASLIVMKIETPSGYNGTMYSLDR